MDIQVVMKSKFLIRSVMKITILMRTKLVFLTESAEVPSNTKNPGSRLRKKSNATCYHYVRERVAFAFRGVEILLCSHDSHVFGRR
mmetsp:Transcript_9414/g.14122  ORF Transcript_9414/g.14122 Transcript_9414/m.14122 type:complete len:86 (+) Transcript_9414:796-1053(+)